MAASGDDSAHSTPSIEKGASSSRNKDSADRSLPHPEPVLLGGHSSEKHEVDDLQNLFAGLSPARKTILVIVFGVAQFVDICNVSGVAVAVYQIGVDTGLNVSQFVWIITSYSLCFASFMLLAGRLADIFPEQLIFGIGLVLLSAFSLATSFVNHSKFGFLILRGLGGLAGALTLPSANALVVHMYPNPAESAAKLALVGMAGAIGNVLGLVIAGVCMLASYVWFFRVISIVCFTSAAVAILLLPIPQLGSRSSSQTDPVPLWRRLDIGGVFLIMGSLICFLLGLTSGPIDGWKSVNCLVPLVLAFPLGIGFFVYESYTSRATALLPTSIWFITNSVIASLACLVPFAFMATSQLQYATVWQEIEGWHPIHVAAAILPQGISALLVGVATQQIPAIIGRPRMSVPIGIILMITASFLQIYSNGGRHGDYWRFCFPAFILGPIGAITVYFASAVNIVVYCPPEMAGIASAWTQVISQVGSAVCLAVQAGLQTEDLGDWSKSSARAYWFVLAWVIVMCLPYVILYKVPKSPEEEHESTRKRIAEK